MAVLTACTLIKNNLDVESATMLAKIGTEKRIMLSGMKLDQTEQGEPEATPLDEIHYQGEEATGFIEVSAPDISGMNRMIRKKVKGTTARTEE